MTTKNDADKKTQCQKHEKAEQPEHPRVSEEIASVRANLSCYSHGVMGYQTPDVDQLARRLNVQFVCNKVAAPVELIPAGALTRLIIRIPQRQLQQGSTCRDAGAAGCGRDRVDPPCATGSRFLPRHATSLGSIYHLNAEEQEASDWPPKRRLPKFDEMSPRSVLKCKADDKDDPTVDK